MTEKTPESTSSDYDAMASYWQMVDTIMAGTDAMRAAGQRYLPKFPNESQDDYDLRLKNAKFTNIFGDIVETLSSKPFEQELTVEKAGSVEPLLEDIDGQGNHLHVFASSTFLSGVTDAITWVFVDYTRGVPAGATQAQERDMGARPYWIHIPACRVLAVYSEAIKGNDTLTHVRIREDVKERDGFGEVVKCRVRVIEREVARDGNGTAISAGPALWKLYEKKKGTDGKEQWVEIDSGAYSIGYIPMFPFITGRRLGSSWVIRPTLQSAAFLQIEHYQQESELKYMRQKTAFAMLAGNGVNPDVGEDGIPKPIPAGPFGVLYAPMDGAGNHGEWTTIEPEGTSTDFCSKEIDKTEAQLRELGRQPLTAQSGNITTITAAFAGDKAHTVIEAWVLNFKDCLENCLKATAEWMRNEIEPEVSINTDFSLSLKENTGMDSLDKARERNDISRQTWFDEAKRRGFIGPNRTFEDEDKRIIAEMPADPTEDETKDAVV